MVAAPVVAPPAPSVNPEGGEVQQVDEVKIEDQSQEETFLIRRKIGLKGVIGNRANDYIEIPKTAN